jgi:peroxiredoxin Q/BCP
MDYRPGNKMSLTIGKPAPDFALSDERGKTVRLSDLRGKKVVIFFYPKAMTSGCTQEACDFRDEIGAFKKRKAAVLGISKDSPEAQAKFKAKHDLPFPLLADEDAKVMKAWGVWQQKSLYGRKFMGCVRTTVVVDPDGKVAQVYPKVKVAGHAQTVLGDL